MNILASTALALDTCNLPLDARSQPRSPERAAYPDNSSRSGVSWDCCDSPSGASTSRTRSPTPCGCVRSAWPWSHLRTPSSAIVTLLGCWAPKWSSRPTSISHAPVSMHLPTGRRLRNRFVASGERPARPRTSPRSSASLSPPCSGRHGIWGGSASRERAIRALDQMLRLPGFPVEPSLRGSRDSEGSMGHNPESPRTARRRPCGIAARVDPAPLLGRRRTSSPIRNSRSGSTASDRAIGHWPPPLALCRRVRRRGVAQVRRAG